MASKNYLIVCGEGQSDSLRGPLQACVGPHLDPSSSVCDFNLPQGALTPKFGSFDNLVKLTDDLAKYDSSTEGCLRRLERQFTETALESNLELAEADVDSQFEVYQGKDKAPVSVGAFLKNGWNWDETKYPAQRSLQKNLEHLLEWVQKIDEDCRNQGQAYSDIKTQKMTLTKTKEGATFPTRDLVELLTPSVVKDGDFVVTEHLTTVVVILARGQDVEFKKWYENPEVKSIRMKDGKEEEHVDKIDPPQTVIPGSLEQFKFPEGGEDKDGNTVWRVVLFKSCKEKFQSLARQNKFVVRDFEYNSSALAELDAKRKGVEAEAAEKLASLTKFCKLAWSDVFTAWLHIKAMRAFVECVLRFGIPSKTKFGGFIICPRAVNPQVRQALAQALPGKVADMADDDGEEYFSYVSLGFAPRAAQVSA